jgi:chemosensory pili system protein ChpC
MAELLSREIRGVMIPVTGGRVLLPNATVAEVITYAVPEKIPNSPPWLLGRLAWRGWRLPLFSFSILTGGAKQESYTNAKVAVLKALSGNAKMPFLAMLAQGFPRLTTITPDLLIPTGDESAHPLGVHAQVLVRDDQAVIPNLGQIEHLVAEAAMVA